MKVKFTKLAALLLAGAALFATGCTDYEVDIQNVDKKVDNLTADVNGKIASLEQQIAGINATIATLAGKLFLGLFTLSSDTQLTVDGQPANVADYLSEEEKAAAEAQDFALMRRQDDRTCRAAQ